MAPTTILFIARDVDALSTSTAPATTQSFVNPLNTGYTGPNIPIWVASVVTFLVLCAILVLCYFTRKASLAWLEQVPELPKPKKISRAEALKKLKLLSGRVTSTTQLPPPMYTAQMKESGTQAVVHPLSLEKPASWVSEKPVYCIPAPPPAYVTGPAHSPLPRSHYALGRLTSANTLKNQRRTAQVFAKPPAAEQQ